MSETKTETQYGVMYGDGQVEWVPGNRADAEHFRNGLRFPGSGSDDYEPMTIVHRLVRTTRSATRWAPA